MRLQQGGELDDTRLVDGIVGEKNIFKQRGEKEPEPGSVWLFYCVYSPVLCQYFGCMLDTPILSFMCYPSMH